MGIKWFICTCVYLVLVILPFKTRAVSVILTRIPLNVTSSTLSGSSRLAVDGNQTTSWTLSPQQTNDNITAPFSPQAVFGFDLTMSNTAGTATPNSILIRLVGTAATGTNVSANWVVYINKTCTDFFYHWSANDLTQCVQFNLSQSHYRVDAYSGLFYTVNNTNGSNGDLIWWQPFSQVNLQINGIESDFAGNSSSFSIAELTILGWPSAASSCNCDPTGLQSPSAGCNGQPACQCRAQINSTAVDNPTCKPVIAPIQVDAYYGPVSGGTVIAFAGNFLQQPASIAIGGRYICRLVASMSTSTDQSFKCIAPPATVDDIGRPMPFQVCWVNPGVTQSCVITRDEFTYRADPTVTSISRKISHAKGGLLLTIQGVNFDSLYGVIGSKLTPLNMVNTLVMWPYVDIIVDNSGKVSRYPFLNTLNPTPPHCDVISSTTMTCKTPENIDLTSSIDLYSSQTSNYKIFLEICLGLFDEVSTVPEKALPADCRYKFPFLVVNNPSITQFDGIQYNEGQSVTIWGNNLLDCCETQDYSITVGGVNGTINSIVTNAISFMPPPPPWKPDSTQKNGASTVILYVGDYSVTVGSLSYVATPCDDPAKHCTALIAGIVGGGAGLIVIVVIIIIVVCRRHRIRQRRENEMRSDPVNYYIGLSNQWRGVPDSEKTDLIDRIDQDNVREKVKRCMVAPNKVELQKEIGRGNFGRVYQGVYNDVDGKKYDAAIKVVQNDNVKDKLEFLLEAVIMADFNHPNVLTLLAITVFNEKPHVVLPLMELGDLRTFISNPQNVLTVRDLINFAMQVADGMDYLAVQMRFVHRDLAARNCMINRDRVVKVADFGLARDIFDSDYYRAQDLMRPLPIKWLAVECLGKSPVFTTQSDVWSYGILLWELMERGEKPYAAISPREMKRYLKEGNRLNKPHTAPDFIYELMMKCWDAHPDERPTFSDISSTLQSHLLKSTQSAAGHAQAEAMAYRPMGNSQHNNDSAVVSLRDMKAASYRQSSAIDNSYIGLTVEDP